MVSKSTKEIIEKYYEYKKVVLKKNENTCEFDTCNKKFNMLPFTCKHCGKNFCSEHRLPEKHNCIWTKDTPKTFWKSERQPSTETTYQPDYQPEPNIKPKIPQKALNWLNRKNHYPYNYSRTGYVFTIIFWLAVSLVSLYLVYSNINELNNNFIWFIQLGGCLFCVAGYFSIKYTYKLLKETVNWFNRQKNWLKILIVVLLLLFSWKAYEAQNNIIDFISPYYNSLSVSSISPIYLNSGEKNTNQNSQEGNKINININRPKDYSSYKTNPKTIKLTYFDFVVYEGVNDYLSDLPRSISYYYTPPTTRDFILRDLDDEVQKEFLLPLVKEIENRNSIKKAQADMAITIVQNIPYDWDGFYSAGLNGRYPYEVLYDYKGVCGEKSELLAFLLRELGFDIVVFEFKGESHRAVGIKCSKGNYNSDYCFIETTDFYPIGQIPYDYVGGVNIRGAIPEIIHISDGISYS
ncbi:MAG: hypothetical protein ISS48_02725 [Candidatus Aenigmarchaeota archaeon]|nr:hypothetical protein [Candidatus Aenigmarchaeota archaeon]